MCERGSVGICCHDSPHAEANRPCLRTFHTVSEGEFCELRLMGVLRSSVFGVVKLRSGCDQPEDPRLGLEGGDFTVCVWCLGC
jgi:hypothetical protein